jgi:hypothetical protein
MASWSDDKFNHTVIHSYHQKPEVIFNTYPFGMKCFTYAAAERIGLLKALPVTRKLAMLGSIKVHPH